MENAAIAAKAARLEDENIPPSAVFTAYIPWSIKRE
jgi:hypothetical protein